MKDFWLYIWHSISHYEDIEMYIRLSMGALFGFAIGLERTIHSKPAGIKTYTFVTVAATLLTLVSIHTVDRYSIPGRTMMDPLRLAAQIVSGLGFLGAGLIIQKSGSVKGLTSASMVFFAGAIGISIGAGYYLMTTYAMIVMYGIISIGHFLEDRNTRLFGQKKPLRESEDD